VRRREPCHGTRSKLALDRARRATRTLFAGGAVPHGPTSLVVGRARPGLLGSVAEPWQAKRAHSMWAAHLGFGPVPVLKLKIHFLFSFGSNLNSNIEKLYLNIQSSKNYEISSVGFKIL
jgi:hypothetical protein